ncbi:MAG: ComEC/Rec2 family competence protein [Bacteroidota bacterium]
MNWNKQPLLRICGPWILGSFLYPFLPYTITTEIVALISGGCLLLVWQKFPFRFRWIKGLGIMIGVASLGLWRTGQADQSPAMDFNQQTAHYASGILKESQRSNSERWRATLLVDQVDTNYIKSFKVLIYFPDSSSQPTYGHRIQFFGVFHSVDPPRNPWSFDYGAYLKHQSIHGQVFLREGQYRILDQVEGYWASGTIFQLRASIRVKLEGLKAQSQHLLAALILGDKSGLDPDIKDAFAKSGALHVLAVSGLHVGLIYTLLGGLARLVFRKSRSLAGLRMLLILGGIWGFVGISGASASVCRAGTMFSFFVIGQQLGRRGNGFNSLSGAAFCLLVIDPLLVFQAGFQLSFLAVWGILFFQHRIYACWHVQHWLLDRIWILVSVSLAAQLATLPLVLFYFGRFSLIFWLSGLWVIPILSVLLPVAIVFLTLPVDWMIFPWIEMLLNKLCHWMIWGVEGMALFPFAEIAPIAISVVEFILILVLVFFLALFWFTGRSGYGWVFLLSLTICSGLHTLHKWEKEKHDWFCVYHLPKGHLIEYYSKEGLFRWQTGDLTLKNIQYAVDGTHRYLEIQKHQLNRIELKPPDPPSPGREKGIWQPNFKCFNAENVPSSWPKNWLPHYVLIRKAHEPYLKQLDQTFPESTWIVDGQLTRKEKAKVLKYAASRNRKVHNTQNDKALLLKIPLNRAEAYQIMPH